MSYREELEQQNSQILDQADGKLPAPSGAPGGARQNVRSETAQGAAARPGGATQNSGGAAAGHGDEQGTSE